MADPIIPGLDAAVTVAVNELRLTYNEGPGDLYDLVHDALTAAYPHLIALADRPTIRAAVVEALAALLREVDAPVGPVSFKGTTTEYMQQSMQALGVILFRHLPALRATYTITGGKDD